MNVEQAISSIHAPKGMSSMIAGVLSGDFDPIREQQGVGASLQMAKEKLQSVRDAQMNCGSDWAFWGYEGDAAYWEAVVDILTAAQLVGANNLPDISAPKLDNCVVMDACSKVTKFGKEILKAAEQSQPSTPVT